MKTVDIAVIRDFIRIFLLLVSKAIEDGIERAFITKEDLYAYKSTRKIAKLINASHQTVGRLFVKMIALPLPLPDFDQMFRFCPYKNKIKMNGKLYPLESFCPSTVLDIM